MLKYLILSLALLAIVPFLILDVSAQTLMKINEPPGFPNATIEKLAAIHSDPGQDYAFYDAFPNRFPDGTSKPIGEIYIQSDTLTLPNPIIPNGAFTCDMNIEAVKTLLKYDYVPGLAVPNNIKPQGNNKIVAIGSDFFNDTDANIPCSPDIEAVSNSPLITEKELRVTLYKKHNKQPYYFSPRDNITEAQPIPACSSTNFNIDDQTLKGDLQMCYGRNGKDMVILTKRLVGFYGAANSVTTPDDPVDLGQSKLKGLRTVDDPKDALNGETLRILSLGASVGGQFEDNGKFRHGYYAPPHDVHTGHIYIPPFTTINPDSADFSDINKYCSIARLFHTPETLSYGIPPNTKGVSAGFGFAIFKSSTDTESCNLKPIQMFKSHETNSTLQVILYNQAGKKGFSYSPLDSDYNATAMPQCSESNFDFDNLELRGDTKNCYYDNIDDLVIFTKKLEWYSAATEINNDPTTPNPDQDWGHFFIKSLGASNNSQILVTDVSLSDPLNTKYRAYMPLNVIINPHPLLADDGQNCLIFNYNHRDKLHDEGPPLNAFGSGAVSINLDYENGSDASTCQFVNASTVNAILKLNDTVRITIKDKSGMVGFYTSPETDVNLAQPVPKCDSTNLNNVTGKLIGSVAKCYDDDGTNLIIYTKNLESYGTRVDPTKPYFYPPHSQFPTTDLGFVGFTGTPLGADKGAYINGNGIYLNNHNDSKSYIGSVYIEQPTKILPNPDLANDTDKECISFQFQDTPVDTLPDNAGNPKSLGFVISPDSEDCTIDLSQDSDHPLLLDREIRIQLDGLAGKKAFYFSPRDNITEAQPIPTCSSENSHINQALNNTQICAIDYDGHLIIISKRLGFYGAADNVTAPANPVNFTTSVPYPPDPANVPSTGDGTGDNGSTGDGTGDNGSTGDGTGDNGSTGDGTGDNGSTGDGIGNDGDSPEYIALLKRLYLPAV